MTNKASGSVRVIGIDPGLASVGYGIVEVSGRKLSYHSHGCISTEASLPQERRLFLIYTELCKILDDAQPNAGAMEALFFAKNVTSALPVAEAKGVIRLAFAQRSLSFLEYTPIAIKQAVTGSGRAAKEDVQNFVRILLNLKEIPKPDHAADALACAIARIHDSGKKL